MIGTRAPSTIPAASALAKNISSLYSFEIGHEKNVRVAADLGFDVLDLRRLTADCIVEGERSVEEPAGDLSSLGHLAQGGGVDLGFTVSTAERIATFGSLIPSACASSKEVSCPTKPYGEGLIIASI